MLNVERLTVFLLQHRSSNIFPKMGIQIKHHIRLFRWETDSPWLSVRYEPSRLPEYVFLAFERTLLLLIGRRTAALNLQPEDSAFYFYLFYIGDRLEFFSIISS